MIKIPNYKFQIPNKFQYQMTKIDKLVKNPEKQFFVIPVKTGIQSF